MKHGRLFVSGGLVGLITLFVAVPCYGQALTPFHYPLGPYPVLITTESWFHVFPLMVPT